MIKSAKAAQTDYEKICEHNQKTLDAIQKQIDERMRLGFDYGDLNTQWSKAKAIGDRGEDLAKRNLEIAKEHEREQEAVVRANLKARSDAVNQKRKEEALRAYVAEGGKADDFEVAWPALRAKMLEDAVAKQATAEREPIIRGL